MITAMFVALIGLSCWMALAWAHQRWAGNGGIADAYWSFGLGVAGVSLALMPQGTEGITERQWLVAVLVAIWSARLGIHIAARHKGAQEDARYAHMRAEWGKSFQRRLFWFLQLQALAAAFLALSIMLAAHHPRAALDGQDFLGAFILLIAIGGEALADWQLTRFKASSPGKNAVCDVGLWRLSRHPNYFFEWLGWLAYPLIAIDFSGAYPWGYLALSGAVFMYWLLVHVSGIPPLEAHMLRARGEVFRTYQRRTNAFFPGPRKEIQP